MGDFLEEKGSNGAWQRFKNVIEEGGRGDDVIRKYSDWADTYDKDYELTGHLGVGHRRVAEAIAGLCNNNHSAHILDICAGTGLAGEQLKNMGFTDLDAVDGSQSMLDIAKSKNIYKKLFAHFLGEEPLAVENDTYDGIMCSGGLFHGHIEDGTCFPDLARIVKSGGGIAMITYASELPRYEPMLKQMQADGIWTYSTEPTSYSPSGKTHPGVIIKIRLH